MNPRDTFEAHFRSADVLVRVYRLLESDNGPSQDHELLTRARGLLECGDDEELILLFNQLFVGIVRERADLRQRFFGRDNLDLLLRQAVVAGCSALDVFVPSLLESYLPKMVLVRQRNFIPNDKNVKDFFRDFRFKLEDAWPLVEEESANERWNMMARRVLDYCKTKTLSNDQGIAASMALIGVEEPWAKIAERAGEKELTLRERLRRVVTRRNDIVHRGDRPSTDPNGDATGIDFVWTQNHVGAIQTVALACFDLADAKARELVAEAGSVLTGGPVS
jgi:RiboL-PSP-HEPN